MRAVAGIASAAAALPAAVLGIPAMLGVATLVGGARSAQSWPASPFSSNAPLPSSVSRMMSA